jgi:hypothetical protein
MNPSAADLSFQSNKSLKMNATRVCLRQNNALGNIAIATFDAHLIQRTDWEFDWV